MKKTLFLLAVLALVPWNSAVAGTISVHIGSDVPGDLISINAPGTLANGVTAYVGSVPFTGGLGAFDAYCVDLRHFIDLPGDYLVVTPILSMSSWTLGGTYSPADAGARASWLYDTYASGVDNNGRVALQLAIWNALYDTDYDVLSGSGFWVATNSYTTQANNMLAALPHSGLVGDARWLQIQDVAGTNYTQDYMGPPTSNVPEPGSMLLLGTGLIGLAGAIRRRMRK